MTAPDPLWDPALDPDPELQRLQAVLAPLGAGRRGLARRQPPLPRGATRRRRALRHLLQGMAAAAALAAAAVILHQFRLDWQAGRPWPVRAATAHSSSVPVQLAPGEMLSTGEGESLTLQVARIGELTLMPGSRLRLVETSAQRHRVDLSEGHLRARIWAPPGLFGVTDGRSEAIDFGCEFDLWKRADGQGRLLVRSGWVLYRIDTRELLVPEAYAIDFDRYGFGLPLRPAADAGFVAAVQTLQQALRGPASGTSTAAEAVARLTQDADAYTLLALLTEHPALADTVLYERLADALGTRADDPAHRRAWRDGDMRAVNAWWQHLPSQPKRWWVNWADVF